MKKDEDGFYFILSEIPFLKQLDSDIHKSNPIQKAGGLVHKSNSFTLLLNLRLLNIKDKGPHQLHL